MNCLPVVIALVVAPLSFRADHGKPASIQKEEAKKGSSATSPDVFKGILRDVLKLVQSIEKQEPKPEGDANAPPPPPFFEAGTKELQANLLTAIGRAQAKLGDSAGAHSTWQSALELIPQTQSYHGLTDQAALYVEIANAQNEAGDRDEVRFTLRQALQSARAIKESATGFPFAVAPSMAGAEYSEDAMIKKIGLLCRIARLQAVIGETKASQETLHQADDTALSLAEAPKKVSALLEIAKDAVADKATVAWAQALDFALGIKDEFPRARCVEMILRARVNALMVDDALDTVANRLKGDLQSFALWVVGDAIAGFDERVAPAAMTRLDQLASKAPFDRPSKKFNVFGRIAEAHARLGDYDGAYRVSGEPHPINNVQHFQESQARLHVMKAIAEAQLKAKKPDAARDTVLIALELIGAWPDEDADAYFPLVELASILARAGDPAGAEQTVSALTSIHGRVRILSEIATAHAQAGRGDLARKAIARALADSHRAPNAAIWSRTDQRSGAFDATSDRETMHPTLQTIAAAQARIGDLDAALKSVKDMGDSGTAYWSRDAAIKQIVTARLEAGDTPGALKAADLLADPGPFNASNGELLEQIARKQAGVGDPASVLEWAKKQKRPDNKLHALRGLTDGIIDRIGHQDSKPTGLQFTQ